MRPFAAALALLLSAAPLRAENLSRAPVMPAVAAGWAATLQAALKAPKLDAQGLTAVLQELSALDLSQAQVAESLAPVAAQLELSAQGILSAASPRTDRLAALIQLSRVLPLSRPQAQRLQEARQALSQKQQERLDQRLALMSEALFTRPDPGTFLLTVKDEGGGKEQRAALNELLARHAGRARVLDRESGSSYLYQAGLQVEDSARADVTRELAAIAGLSASPLSELSGAGLSRARRAAADELPALAALMQDKTASLTDKLGAFAAAATFLERASPAEIAALPEERREALLHGFLHVAHPLKSAFDMIKETLKQDGRSAAYERMKAADEDKIDHAELERAAQESIADPAMRARFAPLREVFTRVLAALDKLETRDSKDHFLENLSEAGHAGLEWAAAHPRRKLRYAKAWTEFVSASVAETVFGLREGKSRDDKWSGTSSSGGYDHVRADRRTTVHYEWRSYRPRPDDFKHAATFLLGTPGLNDRVVELVVGMLSSVQGEVGSLNEIGKKAFVEAKVARAVERHGEARREFFVQAAEEEWQQYHEIRGQSVVTNLIRSLGWYARWHEGAVPGYKATTYISSVFSLFDRALDRVQEQGMVEALTDSAVSFLSSLLDDPVLDSKAGLRARALALWAKVRDNAAQKNVDLVTKLDGVLDRRPELKPGEAKAFKADGDKYTTVWHAAESPDGRLLARAGGDRAVYVWDKATGELVKKITLPDARQHYGDLDNSLGVSWTKDGRLIVATLHDREKGPSFQRLRTYALSTAKKELGPGDELTSVDLNGIHVLTHMPHTPAGQLAVAEVRNYTDGDRFKWEGSDIQLFFIGGRRAATIDGWMLRDAQDALILGGKPHIHEPGLALFRVAADAQPQDVTPLWLKDWTAAWKSRQKQSEYGYWPSLDAKLGSVGGKPALLLHDQGQVQALDLATGAVLAAFPIPDAWRAPAYATDPSGTRLAALTAAPGNINSERLLVWNLQTGELLVDRIVENVGGLHFMADGKQLLTRGKGPVVLYDVP